MKTRVLTFGITLLLFFLLLTNAQAQYAIPGYMKKYETVWKNNPKGASLKWFKEAGFGMFIHFSPASILSGGVSEYTELDPWFEKQVAFEQMDKYSRKQQLLDKMGKVYPEVQNLVTSFNPINFNADSIAELAVSAGMKYITFTTQHVVGKIYMFDTGLSKWNSKRLIERDFVKELSEACAKRDLGLFLYVTPPNDYIKGELRLILKELLTNYGPIAGIWFDGIGECYRRPNDFLETGELYAYINELQPQCLISFKTGFTGDEDFLAPEWNQVKFDEQGKVILNIHVRSDNNKMIKEDDKLRPVLRIANSKLLRNYQSFKNIWETELVNKPVELCSTILKNDEWFDVENGIHKTQKEIIAELNYAKKYNANYLLNVGLRGDGSIHYVDKRTLDGFNTGKGH